ncbi:conserved hypothetical protein [Mesorhizobium plurifarium]|uniref:DUF427 domain-containing protein n=1 Tax=Mesorhizobium plurifarium TaxID=69974 RepID=A0A090GSK5_MESPL|nr:conserved hypothetical protein [Mesorhizobium plurifarium]
MTAAPRLQPREATAPQLINVLHSPKRIRVKFAGRVIADSRNVLVLRSNHFLPIYFFPLAAIDQSVLKPSKQGQQHPIGGETKYWDIEAGDRRAADAAWSFTAPPDENLAPLGGRVAFTWNLVDQWFEEDEEVFVHARDPYARIDVLQSSSHVEIWFDGEPIADSRRPVLLFETHLPTRFYLPLEDVRLDRLRASLTRTRCPYKGIASYWSGVLKDGSLREDIAWSYRDPIAEMPKIKGLIAFYPQAVDRIHLDGQPV